MEYKRGFIGFICYDWSRRCWKDFLEFNITCRVTGMMGRGVVLMLLLTVLVLECNARKTRPVQCNH